MGLMAVVSWGRIPLFIEIIYFLPLSWVGEPLFRYSSDIRAYIATNNGRIFGVFVYSLIYWVLCLFISKYQSIKKGGVNVSS
jgi:hypothetical protein